MKLRRLEVFVAVARAGSFSAAAERLFVAQSAVSVAVRDLEAELGARLFVRGPRAVALTESGRLLLQRTGPALQQIAAAAQEVKDVERLAVGQVRIAAPVIVTQVALARPLASFMKTYPGLQLRMVQGGTREIEELVLAGEADLGVVAKRHLPRELDHVLLQVIDNVAHVPARSPLARAARVSWRELLAQPLATFPQGYHQRELLDQRAAALRLTLRIAVEAESPAVLLEAVRAGVGVTTLPAPASQGWPGIRTVPLPQREGDRLVIVACWKRAQPLGRAAAALRDHLQAALRVQAS